MGQMAVWFFFLIPKMRREDIMCIIEDHAHSQNEEFKTQNQRSFPKFLLTIDLALQLEKLYYNRKYLKFAYAIRMIATTRYPAAC